MSNSLTIMKFGGTSVASQEGREAIATRVASKLQAGEQCLIVVSAMGRTGDPYATDTLLSLVANVAMRDDECALLASTGEIISATVVAAELRQAGIPARAFSGPLAGISADGEPLDARITTIDTHPLLHALEQENVPVVCGFQALGPQGEIVTLGRGGSDTTACALGVALKADCVEIYSDVDGVMTADPRIESHAHVIERLAPDELYQMAQSGSKIVHTPAAELALAAGVPLRIRNTYTDHPGTLVDLSTYRQAALATSVAHTHEISRFAVDLAACEGCSTHMRHQDDVYQALAAANISLDMFTPADKKLLFTVKAPDTSAVCALLKDAGLSFELSTDLAKVTVIGAGMHGRPGVMAAVSRALREKEVDIYQVSDSHTTIAVLVRDEDVIRAVDALHTAFSL